MKSADGSPDEESMTKSPGDGVIYHSGFDPDVMQVFPHQLVSPIAVRSCVSKNTKSALPKTEIR